MNDDNSISLGEKLAFIIGFIATLIALYSFNSQLKNINLDLLIGTYSLDKILHIFLILLGISLYFYALNCIRFDFPILLNIKALKNVEIGGHLFYFLAIFVYPLMLLILFSTNFVIDWFGQYMTISIDMNFPKGVLEGIITIIIAIITTIFTWKQSKETISMFIEIKSESEEDASIKANYDFENKKYNYVPIHLYEQIIQKLESIMGKDYGISISKIPHLKLLHFAYDRKILNKKDFEFIQYLRGLRNSYAHAKNTHDLSKSEVRKLIEETNTIIKKL